MSEFGTLHAALRTDIETLRTDIERRFTHLESKIDQKPNITTIFLVMLITMVLTIGIVGTAAVLLIRETLSFEVLPSSWPVASLGIPAPCRRCRAPPPGDGRSPRRG